MPERLDIKRLLCFDMGGTTAKACLIEHGEPELTNTFEVARAYRFKKGSGYPVSGREAGDLANAVFDRRGRMVAQAVTGTPGHINSLAIGASKMLEEYPLDQIEPGDVLITNDPYKTAGQLLDVTVLVPAWRNGRIIALFGSTIRHTDVGGYGIGTGGRDVFEEGLWIPICKLMKGGQRNPDVWKFILSNVRQPDHMAGDLHAQTASGEVGAQRLFTLCETHGLDDIEALADEIIDRSERATRKSIEALPAGTYHPTRCSISPMRVASTLSAHSKSTLPPARSRSTMRAAQRHRRRQLCSSGLDQLSGFCGGVARGGPVEGLRLRHCWFAQNLVEDQYQTICDWFGCRPASSTA